VKPFASARDTERDGFRVTQWPLIRQHRRSFTTRRRRSARPWWSRRGFIGVSWPVGFFPGRILARRCRKGWRGPTFVTVTKRFASKSLRCSDTDSGVDRGW